MKKMKTKLHFSITNILLVLVMGFVCSCSGDSIFSGPDTEVIDENKILLSISLEGLEDGKEKSSGNIDTNSNTEKQIYSLDVFIFKSQGEYEGGKYDGGKSITRKIINGNEYETISEVTGISLTAGKRDIYVVANAPANHFSGILNLNAFLAKLEQLDTQGLFDHPGTVTPGTGNPPIGGIDPSDLKTNLTMCHFIENVQFQNTQSQHYLGYTGNNGRPGNVSSSFGWALTGTNPFLVERLVARVAIQRIEFDFPAEGLLFETGSNKVTNFTYQIDSVFMMNVKTASKFAAGTFGNQVNDYGHGCKTGYTFLKNKLSNLNPSSQLKNYLTEPIFTQDYDITNIGSTDTPLWYYVFENASTQYPTYFVIGVKYNFESKKNPGVLKTAKCYYPVIVNAPGASGKTADHDYIRRNHQYGIKVKIKGLGTVYGNNPSELKTMQDDESVIEVNETVGKDLFPWTGNTYK